MKRSLLNKVYATRELLNQNTRFGEERQTTQLLDRERGDKHTLSGTKIQDTAGMDDGKSKLGVDEIFPQLHLNFLNFIMAAAVRHKVNNV